MGGGEVPGAILGVLVSWWQLRILRNYHQVSMMLRLATANENSRRGDLPVAPTFVREKGIFIGVPHAPGGCTTAHENVL